MCKETRLLVLALHKVEREHVHWQCCRQPKSWAQVRLLVSSRFPEPPLNMKVADFKVSLVANAQAKLLFWSVFKHALVENSQAFLSREWIEHAPRMNTQAFPSRDCFNPAIVVGTSKSPLRSVSSMRV